MIEADRLRNSFLADDGRIDAFGTVCLVYAKAGQRKNAGRVRVHHHLLHKYADGTHRALSTGARISVLNEAGTIVAVISHTHLMPTGPQLDWLTDVNGFVIDTNEPCTDTARDLTKAARGQCPENFDETPRARVDKAYARRRVVVFWLEDDFPLVFTPDGTRLSATVEYPLSARKRVH